VLIVAKRHRHYYEGDSDNSTEVSKRRRIVELSPQRSSEVTVQRFIRTRHHRQPSKTSRFITDSEDDGTSANDEEGRTNDSDEEFTLGGRRQAPRKQSRRRSSPGKTRSILFLSYCSFI